MNDKKQKPFTINIPILSSNRKIGLGQAIKRIISSIGIKSCESCEQRARSLDRWVRFTGQDKH